MNIILAQLRKDAIPLRKFLIGIGILLALSFISLLDTVPGIHRVMSAMWLPVMHGNLIAGLQFLLLAVLIVRVIHQDSLIDPAAFWKTRPISRAQLLLAKALFIVPLLVLWLVFDVAAGGDKNSGVDVFIFGLAAYATVTNRFSNMVLLFIQVMARAVVFLIALEFLVGLVKLAVQLLKLHVSLTASWSISGSEQLIFQNLIIGCFLVVIIYQYLTLKTRTTLLLIFLAYLAAFIPTVKMSS